MIDSAASAPVVGKRLACKMGVWKRARKVNVKQGDGSTLSGGNYVVDSLFHTYSKGSKVFNATTTGMQKFTSYSNTDFVRRLLGRLSALKLS